MRVLKLSVNAIHAHITPYHQKYGHCSPLRNRDVESYCKRMDVWRFPPAPSHFILHMPLIFLYYVYILEYSLIKWNVICPPKSLPYQLVFRKREIENTFLIDKISNHKAISLFIGRFFSELLQWWSLIMHLSVKFLFIQWDLWKLGGL